MPRVASQERARWRRSRAETRLHMRSPGTHINACLTTTSTNLWRISVSGILRAFGEIASSRQYFVSRGLFLKRGYSNLSTAGMASWWGVHEWIERLMRSRGGQRRDKRLFLVGKLIAIAFNASRKSTLYCRWKNPVGPRQFLVLVVRSFF